MRSKIVERMNPLVLYARHNTGCFEVVPIDLSAATDCVSTQGVLPFKKGDMMTKELSQWAGHPESTLG